MAKFIIASWKRGVLTGLDPVQGQTVGRFSPLKQREDEAVLTFKTKGEAMATFIRLPEVTQQHCRILKAPVKEEATTWQVVHDGDSYD